MPLIDLLKLRDGINCLFTMGIFKLPVLSWLKVVTDRVALKA